MSHRTLPGIPVQDAEPTDCRHSKAGFHCAFTSVANRRHLSDAAKLLHAALVSMVRQRLEWTQTEIADRLGWTCRQKVWRTADELVADGLLTIRRRGLGLPNEYLLHPTEDIHAEDLVGKAPKNSSFGAGHQGDRPRNVPARAVNYSKKTGKNEGYPAPSAGAVDYLATRDHGGTNYLETRYGRLAPR